MNNYVSNLDETNKSLERCRLPKLTQEEIDVNRTSKEIDLVIKKLPMKRSQAQMASLANSTKQITTNSLETLPKNRRRNTF